MLVVECQEHLDKTRVFADRVGKREHLEEILRWLDHDPERKVRLSSDFAPYSFYFEIMAKSKIDGSWIHLYNGGIIFHGHDNGGDDGWSIHT